MSALIPFIFSQFSDNNGNPLSGGTIDAYLTGTTTRIDTYSDQVGTVHANPIVLLSNGKPALPIFLGTKMYDFVLKDSLGNLIETYTAVGDATTGTFTITLTGCTATITGTAFWVLRGGVVTLNIPFLNGTSNTTACTLTGLPAAIRPDSALCEISIPSVIDNSNYYPGSLVVQNSTTIKVCFRATVPGAMGTTFTNANLKGINGGGGNTITITYPLTNS